jgi:hypothetical protein
VCGEPSLLDAVSVERRSVSAAALSDAPALYLHVDR